MVEINCHGGVYITNRVVDICLHHGARLAERGEFSKRAFFIIVGISFSLCCLGP